MIPSVSPWTGSPESALFGMSGSGAGAGDKNRSLQFLIDAVKDGGGPVKFVSLAVQLVTKHASAFAAELSDLTPTLVSLDRSCGSSHSGRAQPEI